MKWPVSPVRALGLATAVVLLVNFDSVVVLGNVDSVVLLDSVVVLGKVDSVVVLVNEEYFVAVLGSVESDLSVVKSFK